MTDFLFSQREREREREREGEGERERENAATKNSVIYKHQVTISSRSSELNYLLQYKISLYRRENIK